MRKAYVILLNWKSWDHTIECLESVFRNRYPAYRVIVCDNESGDGSLEHIADWADGRLAAVVPVDHPLRRYSFPPVPKPIPYAVYDRETAEKGGPLEDRNRPLVLIQTGGNLGFGAGANVGLRYVLAVGDFDYAWLLNNDTVIEPNALEALVARMNVDSAAGQCGSTAMFYNQPERVQLLAGGDFNKWLCRTRILQRALSSDQEENRRLVETRLGFISGVSLLVRKSFLEQVGLLNEDYFLYYEEVDWSLRSQGRFTLAYSPDSVVYHKGGVSSDGDWKSGNTSRLADRLYLENRLKVTRKFFPWALPVVYGTYLGAIVNRIRRGQWDRVGMVLDIVVKGLRSMVGWTAKSS